MRNNRVKKWQEMNASTVSACFHSKWSVWKRVSRETWEAVTRQTLRQSMPFYVNWEENVVKRFTLLSLQIGLKSWIKCSLITKWDLKSQKQNLSKYILYGTNRKVESPQLAEALKTEHKPGWGSQKNIEVQQCSLSFPLELLINGWFKMPTSPNELGFYWFG